MTPLKTESSVTCWKASSVHVVQIIITIIYECKTLHDNASDFGLERKESNQSRSIVNTCSYLRLFNPGPLFVSTEERLISMAKHIRTDKDQTIDMDGPYTYKDNHTDPYQYHCIVFFCTDLYRLLLLL